ncbi:MAG: hypothetical protein E6268_06925 [Veillonella sp.]|uniref:hypothetical protein n=1 Tax=Veillonella sp. TaxID=1926307 RepID=UPI0029062159|nr:hypothetical protein [Veillonella sp.]MDU5004166.1 hypothetical protein [Veillonella sp.]
MHIHLPLVLEAIIFSWIALYWIIYKILLRKKLSPLLVSLIANSDYGFMKVLSWSAIITYPVMLFSMFYFLDYIAIPIVMAWFLLPIFVAAVLLKQPPRSSYYEWARKKQMYVVLIVFAYLISALILLKVNKLI